MTRITVTSNENETIAAGEELAQEISKIKTDRSVIIFLEKSLIYLFLVILSKREQISKFRFLTILLIC